MIVITVTEIIGAFIILSVLLFWLLLLLISKLIDLIKHIKEGKKK